MTIIGIENVLASLEWESVRLSDGEIVAMDDMEVTADDAVYQVYDDEVWTMDGDRTGNCIWTRGELAR